MGRLLLKNSWVGLNLLFSLGLLGAYCAPYVSPNEFWPIAFLGLAFPLFAIINFFFLVYWAIRRSRWVFVSLVMFLMGLYDYPSFIQFSAKTKEKVEEKMLNVVSFNTHYMGAYDRKDNDSTFFFKTLDKINPDVICFQEFANLSGNYEKFLFKEFFKRYRNFANVNADGLSNTYPTGYGVCLFSKYPIIHKGFVELINKNSNLTVFADIVVGSDTIRIVNTHLKSIVFDKVDYQAIQQLKETEGPEVEQVKHIGAKLKYAFKFRANQVEMIRGKLMESPYKVILCGDFNDSPTSYSYHTLRGEMKDAFKESGYGMSRTYIGKMPSFRIDYILHDPSFKSYNYSTHTLNFSDHKMISCTVDLAPKKED